MSSVPRPSALRVGATSHATPASSPSAQARGRDDGRGSPGEPSRAPDVRWTPAGEGDERAALARGGYGARAGNPGGVGGAGGAGSAGGVSDAWSDHIEALGRWCRSDWPLSSTGRSAAASLALAMGVRLGAPGSGNGRGALGEVVRLLLAAAQADVAALRAALADHRTPAARALLANVVGAPWLLATARLRGDTVLGTELRACASREEAAALLTTLAGDAAAGGPLPALRALVTGWVRGPRRDAPLLGDDAREVPVATSDETQLLVLPLLALDGAVPTEPPAAVLTAMLGAATPRVASPFLDDANPLAIGTPVRHEEAEDETAEDEEAEDEGAENADAEDAEAYDDAPDEDGAEERDARTVVVTPPEPAEPEPVEAEVMAAALARLKARAHAVERVDASVASDDGVVEHIADVVPWLSEATVAEVRALARDGWAGEEAIEVARVLSADDPEINEVVRHARRTESELVVEIDGRAASAWLRANRPDIADRLDELLEDDEEDE
ncbi:hypothetical protein [Roseisolibacter agri]|uniref:Uncharacterized protein n=1 Tax=Roseisolibacter agri TaxID=2014610 RepID=A0AA37PZ56_9BACT|nr:hypothetical protein [Roseisolibacter agri]GLC23615.1 hypothetical protein rosag_01280 [Roseisolibacter agri]